MRQGVVCRTCTPSWNAECGSCNSSLASDPSFEDDFPFNESDAKAWLRNHQCFPAIRIIPPPRPEPAQVLAGQTMLPELEGALS
ncbi:hypothetical protein FXF51_56910 [Nonomuraea sp. PA05]|uniref:hypothetical protein n=1 Tax=Nonomuraea sp. PA05 TaxID=2604466 RepID=UPI0011D5E78E|nr:hypothetical protein [Nonomuraea sp. PA05]TYB50262.1 hypothetical protein FXF51_56910 [Nonomuraea sp. PA05]